jgi:chromosome partitioning protein
MSMRIGVCGTKGGSGKSTLAGLLALSLADAGKTIAVKDSDPQKTLYTWLSSLSEPKAKVRDGWLTLGEGEPDVMISDYPPASPDALLPMLGTEWDLLLVPCRPAVADIWSIRSWLEKLKGYNGKVRLVMNCLDNSSISKAGSLDTLLKGIRTPRTKASLSRRACYSYAMVGGWKALDEKAKSEVLSLALEISR